MLKKGKALLILCLTVAILVACNSDQEGYDAPEQENDYNYNEEDSLDSHSQALDIYLAFVQSFALNPEYNHGAYALGFKHIHEFSGLDESGSFINEGDMQVASSEGYVEMLYQSRFRGYDEERGSAENAYTRVSIEGETTEIIARRVNIIRVDHPDYPELEMGSHGVIREVARDNEKEISVMARNYRDQESRNETVTGGIMTEVDGEIVRMEEGNFIGVPIHSTAAFTSYPAPKGVNYDVERVERLHQEILDKRLVLPVIELEEVEEAIITNDGSYSNIRLFTNSNRLADLVEDFILNQAERLIREEVVFERGEMRFSDFQELFEKNSELEVENGVVTMELDGDENLLSISFHMDIQLLIWCETLDISETFLHKIERSYRVLGWDEEVAIAGGLADTLELLDDFARLCIYDLEDAGEEVASGQEDELELGMGIAFREEGTHISARGATYTVFFEGDGIAVRMETITQYAVEEFLEHLGFDTVEQAVTTIELMESLNWDRHWNYRDIVEVTDDYIALRSVMDFRFVSIEIQIDRFGEEAVNNRLNTPFEELYEINTRLGGQVVELNEVPGHRD